MAASAELRGTVALRPVRMALLFEPTLDNLGRAAEYATRCWGGLFYLFISPSDPKDVYRLARAAGVDAIWAVGEDGTAKKIADTPGFRWTGWRGPFDDDPDAVLPSRILDIGWLLDGAHQLRLVRPRWEPDDKLSDLYATWFGTYGSSGGDQAVAARFDANSLEVRIPAFGAVPYLGDFVSPIEATRLQVEQRTDFASTGIVVADPRDANDLVLLWNLRAMGCNVFPWPSDDAARVQNGVEAWLEAVTPQGLLRGVSDTDLAINVWFGSESTECPGDLAVWLQKHHLSGVSSQLEVPRWWTGGHPLRTVFDRAFSVAARPGERSFNVPLPAVPGEWSRKQEKRTGVVAAEIKFYSAVGLDPFWTVNVPNVRELAPVLSLFTHGTPFEYPTYDGRVVGVNPDDEHANIELVRSLSIFEELFQDSEWVCKQTDGGRFASRLVELLGGVSSEAANQPAIRAVLRKAAKTGHGVPLAALVQEAKNEQGEWPWLATPTVRDAYAQRIVNFLLMKKVLRPVLPIKCPHCATIVAVSPEQIESEIRCEMCSETYPLGVVLGLAKSRIDWRFKLAGSVPDNRLAETLPVMATLSVFSDEFRFSMQPPYVLGLSLRRSVGDCEIDIAIAVDDHGPPALVFGEVKSFRDSIDQKDLSNLQSIQRYFLEKSLNCYVLAAVLRDRFSPDEFRALRGLCEAAPSVQTGYSSKPLLPIVLTGADLSVPGMSDQHPSRLPRPPSGMADLALESCKRNLGLIDATWKPSPSGANWSLSWAEDARAAAEENEPAL